MAESLIALRERREQVIARISECYAADVIDVDELDRRLDLAHNASSLVDLEGLVADLAAPAATTALVPTSNAALAVDDPSRPATKRLSVIMSSVERRGRWTVPQATNLRVFWGSAELDFREASIGPGVTTIDVSITMGSLEIILPPQLAVDVDVSSFMGSVEERHRVPPDPDPSRPVLRITGSVRMGSLEIVTRLAHESGSDARHRERHERRMLRKARRRERRALRAGDRALPPGSG